MEQLEVRLILACSRTSRNAGEIDQVRALLREGVDWDRLLRMAQRHRVRPLLFWHLSVACPGAVPEGILKQLRSYFNYNAQHALFLTGELLRIVKLFEAQGITAVPYKGPTLAASVYGNLALREVGDLDILVRKNDILRAEELLASLGYQRWTRVTGDQKRLAGAQERALMHSWGGHNFTRTDGMGMVDLQWTVAKRHFSFRLSPEYLWRHTQRTSLGGGMGLTLSPEILLIVLCMHGSKHLWERLVWVCDVAELIRGSEKLEWAYVMEQARILGSERMLLFGLSLADSLLGAPLPETVLRAVHSDSAVGELAARVRNRLVSEDNSQETPKVSRFEIDHLKMRERWQDRARYCVLTLMTPDEDDWMTLRLPSPLWPLYYALRPIRLIGKFGQKYLKPQL